MAEYGEWIDERHDSDTVRSWRFKGGLAYVLPVPIEMVRWRVTLRKDETLLVEWLGVGREKWQRMVLERAVSAVKDE